MGYRLKWSDIEVSCDTVDEVIALLSEKKKQGTGYRERRRKKLQCVKKRRRHTRLLSHGK